MNPVAHRLAAVLCGITIAAQRPATVTGRVVDGDGAPLAGVAICPMPSGHDWSADELAAESAGHTGDDGAFSVALDDDVYRLLFVKQGHVQVAQRVAHLPVWPVQMPAAALLAGQVRDPDGEPIAGVRVTATDWMRRLRIVRDGGVGNPQAELCCVARTDASGRFVLRGVYPSALRLELCAPGRVDVELGPVSTFDPLTVEMAAASGAPATARERVGRSLAPSPEHTLPKTRVTAVGPDGHAVTDFRAALMRVKPSLLEHYGDGRLLVRFAQIGDAAVDGIAELKADSGYGSGEFVVLATAPGMAMARVVLADVPEELRIEFDAAESVTGRVVDADTGNGIAGARVWFVHGGDKAQQPIVPLAGTECFEATTGADGTFELRDVPLGSGRLYCHGDGFAAAWCAHDVGAGPVRLEVEVLVRLAGRLVADPLPRAFVAVRRKSAPNDLAFLHTTPERLDGVESVARDGAFVLSPQPLTSRPLELLVQRRARQGRPDRVVVHEQELRRGAEPLRIDVEQHRPARVHGRVTGPVPFHRLAVLCAPIAKGSHYYAYLQYEGPLCPVAPDGSYDLQAMPGERILCVIDIETGVMFAREAAVALDAGQQIEHDFAFDAHRVTLRVEASEEQRAAGDWFVECMPQGELWPGGVGQIAAADRLIDQYCKGMGVRVPARTGVQTVWLSPSLHRLGLRRYEPNNPASGDRDARAETDLDPRTQHEIVLHW